MTHAPFHFTRLAKDLKLQTADLSEVMRCQDVAEETWMFVSPHDDDACLGAGLWMQAALKAEVTVYLIVVTDGRMGYCEPGARGEIIQTRRMETFDSCAKLGLDQSYIRYIDYPDGGLFALQGRMAKEEKPGIEDIHGYVGLQNAMTYHLRQLRPSRVFVPTPTDLHPDHRITYSELMISLFHASGPIWPELGPQILSVPKVYEMAVYCDFSEPPTLEIRGDPQAFTRKVESIAAFRSQAQIAKLVESVRAGGPYEYLREIDFRFYSPQDYRPLFA